MKVITTNWQTHEQELRILRERVFIHEQQVPVADEWDDKDDTAIHFLVQNAQGKNIACARLLIENNLLLHIGRVAVLKEHRHQGVGRYLMRELMNYCTEQYPSFGIYLHAQTQRQAFYAHLGFTARGSIFMDAGIPHIEMWFDHKEEKNYE